MKKLKLTIINPDDGIENKVTIDRSKNDLNFTLKKDGSIEVHMKGLRYSSAMIKDSLLDIAMQMAMDYGSN